MARNITDIRYAGLGRFAERGGDNIKVMAIIATTDYGYFSVSGRLEHLSKLRRGQEYVIPLEYNAVDDLLANSRMMNRNLLGVLSSAYTQLQGYLGFEALPVDEYYAALGTLYELPTDLAYVADIPRNAYSAQFGFNF